MGIIRILHVSDFHFCVEPRRENLYLRLRRPKSRTISHFLSENTRISFWRPESYDPDLADALAMFCAENVDEIDLVLVTGDLATTGLANDLGVAKSFVEAPVTSGYLAANGTASIHHEDLPVFVMPGNHDRYRGDSAEPGSNTFDLSFAKTDENSYRSTDSIVLEAGDGDLLGIISCDHCLGVAGDADIPVALCKYGQGRVYESRLLQLERETENMRRKHKRINILWVSHFPLFDGVPFGLKLKYKENLLALAEKMGIEIILSGHVHRFEDQPVGKLRNISADASISIDRASENEIHTLEFNFGATLIEPKIERYRFSARDGAFRPLTN